jgi:hypothetical protein
MVTGINDARYGLPKPNVMSVGCFCDSKIIRLVLVRFESSTIADNRLGGEPTGGPPRGTRYGSPELVKRGHSDSKGYFERRNV